MCAASPMYRPRYGVANAGGPALDRAWDQYGLFPPLLGAAEAPPDAAGSDAAGAAVPPPDPPDGEHAASAAARIRISATIDRRIT